MKKVLEKGVTIMLLVSYLASEVFFYQAGNYAMVVFTNFILFGIWSILLLGRGRK